MRIGQSTRILGRYATWRHAVVQDNMGREYSLSPLLYKRDRRCSEIVLSLMKTRYHIRCHKCNAHVKMIQNQRTSGSSQSHDIQL